MERLLQLKEPVVEYFRRNSNDKRRLISHDWNVTNQVCSILDPIAEVSIKIQGAEDTYISQATFLMKELMEIMTSECLQIRVPDKPGMDPVRHEKGNKSELFPEVETAVEVYREVMEEKDLGRALNPTERINVFLDSRRKMMSEDDCIGVGNALQTMAISDIEELGHHFVGNVAQTSKSTPAPAPAPAPALVPSPAPAPAPAPDLATPAVTLPRISSVMEQRRLARLAAAGHEGSSHGAQGGGVQPGIHYVALRQELTNYRGQNVEADVRGFSLPGFWQERADGCSGHGRACGATGSAPSSTRCPSLPRGRSDQLVSRAQLFFALVFDWHLAGKHGSV